MLTMKLIGNNIQLRTPGIAIIGSPLMDIIAHVDEDFVKKLALNKGDSSPISTDHLNVILGQLRTTLKRSIGGSSLNVAFGLAGLASRIAFIGKLGIDYDGLLCHQQMREAGIAAWTLCDKERPTGRVLCLVTPDGERTMLADIGASAHMQIEEFTGMEMHNMGIVHFEGYQVASPSLCQSLMGMAKARGALVSLDLASLTWVQSRLSTFQDLISSHVDILFGNYHEMQTLTGLLDPQQICHYLSQHLRWVFLTSGKEGIWCSINGHISHFPVTPIIPHDTTGAGDLFCAGILHAMRWNWPLDQGVALAARLATEVIKIDGTKLSPKTWNLIFDEFRDLLGPNRAKAEDLGALPPRPPAEELSSSDSTIFTTAASQTL